MALYVIIRVYYLYVLFYFIFQCFSKLLIKQQLKLKLLKPDQKLKYNLVFCYIYLLLLINEEL